MAQITDRKCSWFVLCILKHRDKLQVFEGHVQDFHYMMVCKTGVNAKIDRLSAVIFIFGVP
jgi:hypothetical protein